MTKPRHTNLAMHLTKFTTFKYFFYLGSLMQPKPNLICLWGFTIAKLSLVQPNWVQSNWSAAEPNFLALHFIYCFFPHFCSKPTLFPQRTQALLCVSTSIWNGLSLSYNFRFHSDWLASNYPLSSLLILSFSWLV